MDRTYDVASTAHFHPSHFLIVSDFLTGNDLIRSCLASPSPAAATYSKHIFPPVIGILRTRGQMFSLLPGKSRSRQRHPSSSCKCLISCLASSPRLLPSLQSVKYHVSNHLSLLGVLSQGVRFYHLRSRDLIP